jgi:hypothetical protein
MKQSNPQILHINAQESITVTCPSCGNQVITSAKNYKDKHTPLLAQCHCGKTFEVLIDTRIYYRKDVQLRGNYTMPESDRKRRIIIDDLSFSGLRFRTLGPNPLQTNDKIEIRFCLDEPPYEEITQEVIVRWSTDHLVGGEFIDRQSFEKLLGFYLMK